MVDYPRHLESHAAAELPAPGEPPTHRAMFAIDIIGFGRHDAGIHAQLRSVLYQIAKDACRSAGLDWSACYNEDRGDGIVVLAPAYVGAEVLLGPLAVGLRTQLGRHNAIANQAAQIKLRVAVDAGYVQFDEHGVVGRTVLHLFRLLEADTFKAAITARDVELGLVTSNYLYEELIRHAPGRLDPATFMPITIEAKETTALAWVWLPHSIPAHTPRPAIRAESTLDPYGVMARLLVAAGWTPPGNNREIPPAFENER